MILADSGPLVANFLLHDPQHERVVRFIRENSEPIVVPSLVITEVSYFLERNHRIRDEARFLRSVARGATTVADPVLADYARAADLVEQYANFPLGTVDAVIAAMAERMNVTTLFTLDRRHFGAIRPAHCQSFTLVP